jgi:hypothetical protein
MSTVNIPEIMPYFVSEMPSKKASPSKKQDLMVGTNMV